MQASRSAPDQVASMRRKRTTGGTIQARKRIAISVSAMLNGDENRLARSQPSMPARDDGGGRFAAGAWRKNKTGDVAAMASALHNGDGAPVEIHRQRSEQADREINRHGD